VSGVGIICHLYKQEIAPGRGRYSLPYGEICIPCHDSRAHKTTSELMTEILIHALILEEKVEMYGI